MSKLLIALIFSIASTSYAVTVENKEDSSVSNSETSQVQKQHNRINKNKKISPEKARETKSKDKGMHIKDDVTHIKQNEPEDVEIRSPRSKVEQE